ncbi:MAG: hypothetical protein ACRYHQ_27090 [Janthinobacterium lividum]
MVNVPDVELARLDRPAAARRSLPAGASGVRIGMGSKSGIPFAIERQTGTIILTTPSIAAKHGEQSCHSREKADCRKLLEPLGGGRTVTAEG